MTTWRETNSYHYLGKQVKAQKATSAPQGSWWIDPAVQADRAAFQAEAARRSLHAASETRAVYADSGDAQEAGMRRGTL